MSNGRLFVPGSKPSQAGLQVVALPNTQLLILMTAAVRQASPDKNHQEVVAEAIELIAQAVYWDSRGYLKGAIQAATQRAEEDEEKASRPPDA